MLTSLALSLAALSTFAEARLGAGVHALGSRAARARLVEAASTRGLNAVVLGGSISFRFAGSGTGKSRAGFVQTLIDHVGHRFPTHRHTLANFARSGNDARQLRPCARSYVQANTDVVFIDYAVNGGTPEDFEQLLGIWQSYPGGGPMLVLLNNFFWCRTEHGEHALTAALRNCSHRKGAPAACKAAALRDTCFVQRNGERLLRATRCAEAALEASMAPCGAAVLSIFDVLAPQVISGALSSTQAITEDGYHPPKGASHPSTPSPMVAAWAELLVHWFDLAVDSLSSQPQPNATEPRLVGGQDPEQRARLAQMLGACARRPPGYPDTEGRRDWAHLADGGCRVAHVGATNSSGRRTRCYSADGRWLPRLPVLHATGWHFVAIDGGKQRPGYVSLGRGDVLRIRMPADMGADGSMLPVKYAAVSLLHSYENAGTVRLRCEGSCDCPANSHSTRWAKLSSGDVNVGLAVSHRTGSRSPRTPLPVNSSKDEAGEAHDVITPCVLELTNESDEKVKLDALVLDVRR